MIKLFISQSAAIRSVDRGRCEVNVSELWWGRSEGYFLAWVKVNEGWAVLNIEGSPLSSPCQISAPELCNNISYVLRLCESVKHCPLAAEAGEFTTWYTFASAVSYLWVKKNLKFVEKKKKQFDTNVPRSKINKWKRLWCCNINFNFLKRSLYSWNE